MANMNSKKPVQIIVDFSKTIGKPDEKDVVLLFDEASNCYYRASLSHVIGAALKVVDKRCEEMEKKVSKEFAKNEAFKEELSKKQSKFIADTRQVVDSIINLVEGGNK